MLQLKIWGPHGPLLGKVGGPMGPHRPQRRAGGRAACVACGLSGPLSRGSAAPRVVGLNDSRLAAARAARAASYRSYRAYIHNFI